jgi:hypothetical protein
VTTRCTPEAPVRLSSYYGWDEVGWRYCWKECDDPERLYSIAQLSGPALNAEAKNIVKQREKENAT